MVIKIAGKVWNCNNQCKVNCCSDIFLPVNKKMKQDIEDYGCYYVDNNYTDFRWLGLRENIDVEKKENGLRKIVILTKDYEFKTHNVINQEMIYIRDKCSKLMKDGRCKVYRNRPMICKKAECPVFTRRQSISWYAKNSDIMKEARKKFEKGELRP